MHGLCFIKRKQWWNLNYNAIKKKIVQWNKNDTSHDELFKRKKIFNMLQHPSLSESLYVSTIMADSQYNGASLFNFQPRFGLRVDDIKLSAKSVIYLFIYLFIPFLYPGYAQTVRNWFPLGPCIHYK